MVVLPLGISVSTMSSGYSINCRITHSRNSIMTKNSHESTRNDTNFCRIKNKPRLSTVLRQAAKAAAVGQTSLHPRRLQSAARIRDHFDYRLQICVGSPAAVSSMGGSGGACVSSWGQTGVGGLQE